MRKLRNFQLRYFSGVQKLHYTYVYRAYGCDIFENTTCLIMTKAIYFYLVSSTGFLYDEFFTKHKNPWASNFPEKPQRVSESYKRCCELGLVDRCTRIQVLKQII